MQERIQELRKRNQVLIEYNKHLKVYALPYILRNKVQVQRVSSAKKEYKEQGFQFQQQKISKEGIKRSFSKKKIAQVQQAQRQSQLLSLQWDAKSFNPQKLFLMNPKQIRFIPDDYEQNLQIRTDAINIFQGRHQGCMVSCEKPLPKIGKYRIKFYFLRNKSRKYPITIGIMTQNWKNKEYFRKSKGLISYHFCHNFGAYDVDQKQLIPWAQNGLGLLWSGNIEMIVDLDKYKIEFIREGSRKKKDSQENNTFPNKHLILKQRHFRVRLSQKSKRQYRSL